MRVLVASVALCACGRIGFDPSLTAGDASVDPDASAVSCAPFAAGWVVDPPVLVAELSLPSSTEAHPFLTPDGLTLYFMSDRGGTWDVFRATRPSHAAPFEAAVLVPELSSAGKETGVALSADGLEVFLSTDRAGGEGGADIWRATRASPQDAFANLAPVASLSTPSWDYEPTLSRDGQRMYFVTENYPGFPGGGDPVVADRQAADAWSPPMLVGALASANNEYGLTTTRDELVAVVSTDRDRPAVDYDLYVATRSSTNMPFQMSRVLTELSSPVDDGHPFFSDDGCELYFDTYRSGSGDLYVARWRQP